MTRIRRVKDQQEMEKLIDEFIIRGYRIVSDGEESVNVKKKDWGDSSTHFIIAILTIWWTFGFANFIYALYSRVSADEVLIKIDDDPDE